MQPERLVLILTFLAPSLCAQTYQWSPPGTGSGPGGSGNTIPFWSQSGTYQQVHDAAAMGRDPALSIQGLAVRPEPGVAITGRTCTMRLSLSVTNTTALTASETFAQNLGPNTSIVFGTAPTWQNFSWSSTMGTGTKPAFTVPFQSPFLYLRPLGNLCWEWRFRDATNLTSAYMDTVSGLDHAGRTGPSSGRGCVATGGSSPATATLYAYRTQPTHFHHYLEIGLTDASANAGTVLALGLRDWTTSIGWCAPILTPLVTMTGRTDATGRFALETQLTSLAGTPSFTVYAQFGFADAALPGGIGLSDIASYRTPEIPGTYGITRIYRAFARNPTNGDANALDGTVDRAYGLSVGWLK